VALRFFLPKCRKAELRALRYEAAVLLPKCRKAKLRALRYGTPSGGDAFVGQVGRPRNWPVRSSRDCHDEAGRFIGKVFTNGSESCVD
jgi:hypothetical protein